MKSNKTVYAMIDELDGEFSVFDSLAEAEAHARAIYRNNAEARTAVDDSVPGWYSEVEVSERQFVQAWVGLLVALEVTSVVTCQIQLAACHLTHRHSGMYRMMGWRPGRVLSSFVVLADLEQTEWYTEATWELEYEGTTVRAVKTLKGKTLSIWTIGEMV